MHNYYVQLDHMYELVSYQPGFEERTVARPALVVAVIMVEGQRGRAFQRERHVQRHTSKLKVRK